jgi:hypothetical protein
MAQHQVDIKQNVALLKPQYQTANWKYTPGYIINKGDP